MSFDILLKFLIFNCGILSIYGLLSVQWVSSIGLNGLFQGGVHHEVSDSSLAEVRVPHSPAGFPGAIVAGG